MTSPDFSGLYCSFHPEVAHIYLYLHRVLKLSYYGIGGGEGKTLLSLSLLPLEKGGEKSSSSGELFGREPHEHSAIIKNTATQVR